LGKDGLGSGHVWKVLVVEDDRRAREFFCECVRRSSELELVGEFGGVKGALDWLRDPVHRVDVLLVDLGLPDGSGLDVIRATTELHPMCESLVISMFADEENVLASIEAGALGYIHKDSAPDDIARSIIDMKHGCSPISPMIARRVLEKYRHGGVDDRTSRARGRSGDGPDREEDGAIALSDREREVLDLIARGFSYAEVARLKLISVDTVRSHIKHLYGKLAVHSRSEAVFEATRMGLL
jgi:DNA-binding NarL/FixJ family response regulator